MHEPGMTGAAGEPVTIADGVILLDLGFQGRAGAIGSWLLSGGDEVVLLEVGPDSTRENLERMVKRAGYAWEDVSRLIVTHIHLDHAGAAGGLMRDYPHLRLSVQEDAAPFLVSIERLWKSATRIYGDQMAPLWGDAVDVDADRVDTFRDGDRLAAAGTTLLVRATPGHSGTHVSFLDEQRGILFTGDAAGARMTGSDVIVPTLAPPELDFGLWAESIRSMKELLPTTLALTHMGVFRDVDRHLDAMMPEIEASMEIAGRVLRSAEDELALTEALTQRMRERFEGEGSDAEDRYRAMQLAMPTYLAAKGLMRVMKKQGRI